jgi:DNA (cytosine-5)-methyltransferase 1
VSLTYTDIFCGAGGSSIGLTEAGFELKLAANHWDRAIETHSSNFPDAEHLCADVNNYDMRRLPRTAVLWASPICTENSPAGGRKRRSAQPDLFDHGPVADGAFERTRATFWDVIRATEVHRYLAVIVENVVEAASWELFDLWTECMRKLGYEAQFVSVSTAHVGDESNPHAPQWRDRLYVVFTRTGIPLPDVAPRPVAWCSECDLDVLAVQSWKDPRKRKIGKYRQQYLYRCPNGRCRQSVVEPYVLPAAAAIDWSDLGQRIGERTRPLAPKTLARIRAGLAQFAQPITLEAAGNTFERRPGVRTWPAGGAPLTTLTGSATKGVACPPFVVYGYSGGVERRVKPIDDPLGTIVANGRGHYGLVSPPVLFSVNHDDDHGRAYPADAAPLPPRTTKIGDALACRPFVTMLRANNQPTGTDEPLATVTTGRHHYLTVPPGAFFTKHYTPRGRDGQMAKDVRTDPLGAILAAGGRHSLVVPYYRTGKAKTTASPLDTVTVRDRFALVDPASLDVDDCLFRMLQPREHLRAQRFPDSYRVLGNKGEQTMQAGNAVSANVAHWLGRAVAAVLSGATLGTEGAA